MINFIKIYLNLGIEHILDVQAYDHLLFLIALCAVYLIKDWKTVLLLATAFTIGHSITLGLAASNKIFIEAKWIEFLIPLTIALTGIYNLLLQKKGINSERVGVLKYLSVLFFGLIHGLGFSNFFRATILPGQEDKFLWQLFSFNLGVEVAQIIIILVFLLSTTVIINVLGMKRKYWITFLSFSAIVIAVVMMGQRWPI